MKLKGKFTIAAISTLMAVLLFSQCSIYKTIVNMSRLKFKLNGIQNIYVAGVSVSAKSRLQDFNLIEIASITSAISKGRLPVDFVLNVAARNPNDGSGGYARTDATLKSMPYRFMIDDKQILSGNITSPVTVPGTGEEVVIPISIGFDAIQTFQNKNYESIVNLLLNISGKGSSPSNIALYAKPTIKTILGDISYPGELKIIEHEFRDK